MIRIAFFLTALIAETALSADVRPMTYAEFLMSVRTHSPATCPETLLQPGVFCEVATGPYGVRVFAFSMEGERPMVAFASYNLAQLEVLER
ncbi:MAG: hypothetical protein AAF501_17125 [Pseudomonadota bacterium]